MDHCVECHVCHQWYDVTMNSSYKNKCSKCYYQLNKEKYKQRAKKYAKTDKGKKTMTIAYWKYRGLICENYDQVYQLWLDSTHCDKCGCQYTDKIPKDMEHCHTTGRFRAIVCHKCNMNMLDKKKQTNNKSGHKNICYYKRDNVFIYSKRYYGKMIRHKSFKTKVDALCYKYIMLLRLKAGHFD